MTGDHVRIPWHLYCGNTPNNFKICLLILFAVLPLSLFLWNRRFTIRTCKNKFSLSLHWEEIWNYLCKETVFVFFFFMCKQKPSWKCRLNKHLKLKASHMHTYLTLLNVNCFRQKRKFYAFPSPSWWNHLHMPLYSLTFKVMLRCCPRTFRSSLKFCSRQQWAVDIGNHRT